MKAIKADTLVSHSVRMTEIERKLFKISGLLFNGKE